MNCRTPTVIEFRTKLGFNQHDFIMTKEQSVLTGMLKIFAREKILLQYSVLHYRTDLYFPEHKLPIEIDEKGHKDRDKHKDNKRQKAIEKELDFKCIRINPDEKNFYMDIHISKIKSHIVESTKKLIKKILNRQDFEKTIRIRFKSNHLIKSKCCQKNIAIIIKHAKLSFKL